MNIAPQLPDQIAASDYRNYLEALLRGDRHACREYFAHWVDEGLNLRLLYQEVVQRSLYEIGRRWECGKISVATEHLATAITESLLNLVYPRLFAQPRRGHSAVVTCVANEFHQIGGKIVADMFELHGWNGYFLGANTPLHDTLQLVADKRPKVVALSITVAFNLDRLIDAITQIHQQFPDLPILVGGQALRWGGQHRIEQHAGISCLPSLAALEAWIDARNVHA